jgi:molybdopterin molybdotransferase
MDVSKNTIIKKAGEKISSAEINIAASVGKDKILVKELPSVAVISTGDELVDVHEFPLEHQIRRSNVYGIRSTFEEWGIQADLKHLPDDKELMQKNIAELLVQYDILVITGGVSKGKVL